VIPPNTILGVEMTFKALQESATRPSELALTQPVSFPPLNELTPKRYDNKGALTT
jgi:hypothetical protein